MPVAMRRTVVPKSRTSQLDGRDRPWAVFSTQLTGSPEICHMLKNKLHTGSEEVHDSFCILNCIEWTGNMLKEKQEVTIQVSFKMSKKKSLRRRGENIKIFYL